MFPFSYFKKKRLEKERKREEQVRKRHAVRNDLKELARLRKIPLKQRLPGWDAKFLANLDNVGTVVDVGVLDGTPALYKAFPEAYLVLVEALPSCEAACRAIVSARPGEVHMCALGDHDGQIQINYIPERPAITSTLEISRENKGRTTVAIDVPIFKADTLFANSNFPGDVLLKIDTEGMELAILNGATNFLRSVKYVITETSIAHRHLNSYRMVELMAKMDAIGFDVLDILTVTRPNTGKPGANISDVLFVRRTD